MTTTTAPRSITKRKPATSTTQPPWGRLRALGVHLLIPLTLAAGMAFAYLGAFHQPSPNELEVGVLGSGASTQVFAQTLTDDSNGAFVAHTVVDDAAARAAITDRTLAAVYAPGRATATLYVASAASATTATIAEHVFTGIAAKQGLPLTVVDVVPTSGGDGSGQGLFFLLVALSIGGYASAIALAGFSAHANHRWTTLAVVGTSGALSALVLLIAGPVYGVVHAQWALIWLLSWWYMAVIQLIGIGLHPLLKAWTTPTLTAMFVMLNFTSSGGVFAAAMQPALFSGLNSFWIGAAWLRATTTLQYFWGQNIGWDVITMGGWTLAAAALAAGVRSAVAHRARLARDVRITEEDTLIAA